MPAGAVTTTPEGGVSGTVGWVYAKVLLSGHGVNMKKPTKQQWEQLRNLDRMATKAGRGTHREKYLREEIQRLRDRMGLARWSAPGAEGDVAAKEHLSDSLSANADLFADL